MLVSPLLGLFSLAGMEKQKVLNQFYQNESVCLKIHQTYSLPVLLEEPKALLDMLCFLSSVLHSSLLKNKKYKLE